uniref:Uncharacterized protein n=1 Tax=Arundo donax TaxID=35708 RepID=A0A0A9GHL8_ARUDO
MIYMALQENLTHHGQPMVQGTDHLKDLQVFAMMRLHQEPMIRFGLCHPLDLSMPQELQVLPQEMFLTH